MEESVNFISFINIQSFNHSIKIKSYFDFIYELISFVDSTLMELTWKYVK